MTTLSFPYHRCDAVKCRTCAFENAQRSAMVRYISRHGVGQLVDSYRQPRG